MEQARLRVVYEHGGQIARLIDEHGQIVLDFDDVVWAAPVNTVAPAVTPGTALTGAVLACTTGVWTHNALTYAYAWYRDGAAIDGATAATHTCVVADEDTALTCKVIASSRGTASEAAESNAVVPTAAP